MASGSRHLLSPSVLGLVAGIGGPSNASSQPTVDPDREQAELLGVHRNLRDAHFRTDVDLLLKGTADQLIYVRDGKITRRSKHDMRQAFSEYFRDATYYEWDDIEPPVVRISRDATMGWMITNVRVRRAQPTSTGTRIDEFVYAGLSTYEKRDGHWTEVANVSTFEPRT